MNNDILVHNAVKSINVSVTSQNRELSTLNSAVGTVTILAGQSWVGTAETSTYTAIAISGYISQTCTGYIEFSHDAVNWDSSLSYIIRGNFNEVHRLINTKSYFRVRLVNNNLTDVTARFECFKGEFGPATSNLNGTIQNDADSIIVRPMDFNLMLAEGLYENRGVTIKDGYNPDVDTASVPEDLWDNSGVYTGFIDVPAAAQIRVTSAADIGTVYYSYMATATDTNYTFGSIAVNGIGTYPLGHNIFRSNFSYIELTNTANFNAGTIFVETTGGVIFNTIPIGHSQSYCAAYSVPFGGFAFIDRITSSVRGGTSGQCDGYFYYKPWGKSPILRFPHEYQSGNLYFDDMDYLIRIPGGVDIIPRITAASANNLIPKVSYRILLTRSLT